MYFMGEGVKEDKAKELKQSYLSQMYATKDRVKEEGKDGGAGRNQHASVEDVFDSHTDSSIYY